MGSCADSDDTEQRQPRHGVGDEAPRPQGDALPGVELLLRREAGPQDAVEATKLISPKLVAPAHYNTWPPIEQDVTAWASEVKARTNAEAIVLEPGQSHSLRACPHA